MARIKLATFNAEWMWSLFGATANSSWDGEIPAAFPGATKGVLRLAPIADVPRLCRRIAGTLKAVNADILAIQEGPPLKAQMELFVRRFLDDAYEVFQSNPSQQSVYLLVRRGRFAEAVTWLPAGATAKALWTDIPFYPWGAIGTAQRKAHDFDRHPLLVRVTPAGAPPLLVCAVHTKSKYSRLKSWDQWVKRERAAVLDALNARQKLSAEVRRLHTVLAQALRGSDMPYIVLLGDLNDGPYADLMEQEFLVHSILDELVGSFLLPDTHFRHALEPQTLAGAASTAFPDPFSEGRMVEELIDHILVSPAIWGRKGGYRIVANSGRVEDKAWAKQVASGGEGGRDSRPSDHKPVSVSLVHD